MDTFKALNFLCGPFLKALKVSSLFTFLFIFIWGDSKIHICNGAFCLQKMNEMSNHKRSFSFLFSFHFFNNPFCFFFHSLYLYFSSIICFLFGLEIKDPSSSSLHWLILGFLYAFLYNGVYLSFSSTQLLLCICPKMFSQAKRASKIVVPPKEMLTYSPLYVFWLTMTSQIETIGRAQYTPLYENNKIWTQNKSMETTLLEVHLWLLQSQRWINSLFFYFWWIFWQRVSIFFSFCSLKIFCYSNMCLSTASGHMMVEITKYSGLNEHCLWTDGFYFNALLKHQPV